MRWNSRRLTAMLALAAWRQWPSPPLGPIDQHRATSILRNAPVVEAGNTFAVRPLRRARPAPPPTPTCSYLPSASRWRSGMAVKRSGKVRPIIKWSRRSPLGADARSDQRLVPRVDRSLCLRISIRARDERRQLRWVREEFSREPFLEVNRPILRRNSADPPTSEAPGRADDQDWVRRDTRDGSRRSSSDSHDHLRHVPDHAVYFKGLWAEPSTPKGPARSRFSISSTARPVTVRMYVAPRGAWFPS